MAERVLMWLTGAPTWSFRSDPRTAPTHSLHQNVMDQPTARVELAAIRMLSIVRPCTRYKSLTLYPIELGGQQ